MYFNTKRRLLAATATLLILLPLVGRSVAQGAIPTKRTEQVNANSNLCLDQYRGLLTAGGPAIQWVCDEGANQKLDLVANGDGSYKIKFNHSGMCLTANAPVAASTA